MEGCRVLMIQLVNVEKTYYSKAGNIEALKKTNLEIRDGEIFGIIGLSGAANRRSSAASTCWKCPRAARSSWTGRK